VKHFFRLGLFVVGSLAVVSFIISSSVVWNLPGSAFVDGSPARGDYHFAMFVPVSRNAFVEDLVAGAKRAAAQSGVALSVRSVDSAGTSLRMAKYLGADGAVVFPNSDDALMGELLGALRATGLPIVLTDHNVPADQPWPFVGTNNFDLGRKAGAVAMEGSPNLDAARAEDIRLAVVYSDKTPWIYAERELVEMGITSTLGSRLAPPIERLRTDRNPRDAERVVYELVKVTPPVTVVVFTDVDDTLAGAQALVDLNLVGKIDVVGFGSTDGIREFIKKGVIRASLSVHPESIGFQAIRSLVELKRTGYTSQSVDTGIDVVGPESVPSWQYGRSRVPEGDSPK